LCAVRVDGDGAPLVWASRIAALVGLVTSLAGATRSDPERPGATRSDLELLGDRYLAFG
jgi:hypothetical protein